ncbi:MAG: hypothetical protein K2X27_11260 [Candidatus Obscuribacterales bacterium]|nr:hypothetical protein [Candidatus Obscuribacterales bacterium]
MPPYELPPESLDVSAETLARIFDDVTNSYKFLFFLALLENIERNHFDASIPIGLAEMILDMLTLAWYPHIYFRLSFGRLDKIALALDAAAPRQILAAQPLKPWDRREIRKVIAANLKDNQLARFVPYRLIRPFFPETRGMAKDHEVNSRVAELAAAEFANRKPLYKFDARQERLILHSSWARYFQHNIRLIRGWAHWHFLEYMQRCNPSVPGIAHKLFAPAERESLEKQTAYWKAVLTAERLPCIYTGELLSADAISLDHFVPWSFVVHNQLWNLVPTSRSVNSQKSDRLPDRKFFAGFVATQAKAAMVSRNLLKAKSWQDQMSCYLSDLGLANFEALLDAEQLSSAYEGTILPLLKLAEANGFEPGWVPK